MSLGPPETPVRAARRGSWRWLRTPKSSTLKGWLHEGSKLWAKVVAMAMSYKWLFHWDEIIDYTSYYHGLYIVHGLDNPRCEPGRWNMNPNIYSINDPNVGKYTIHGASGNKNPRFSKLTWRISPYSAIFPQISRSNRDWPGKCPN